MPRKKYYLYHCRFLSVPIVGVVIYKLQYYLFSHGFINIIYLSGKESFSRDKLVGLINIKLERIFCCSIELENVLKKINSEIILDITLNNLTVLKTAKLYDLMWTLVFCRKVTRRTQISLKKILPEDYPIYKE